MAQILVYSDEGVSPRADWEVPRSLRRELSKEYQIRCVRALDLTSSDWEKEALLFVLPGGRDVPYQMALAGAGNRRIRNFVETGGRYLGLCAGAYYACDRIEFDKGQQLEVCSERDLKFFPGLASGPAYGPGTFTYEDESGTRAAELEWLAEEALGAHDLIAYYNGGCVFSEVERYSSTKVLASYKALPGNPAAIVECMVKHGRAILSGVHIEYSAESVKSDDPFIGNIFHILSAAEQGRRVLFRALLVRLGLKITPTL